MINVFSTLGCPYWSFEQAVRYAAEYGYDAIAVRFLDGQRYLPDFPAFALKNRETAIKLLAETKVSISSLNGSCCFHDESEGENALREGTAIIDIAKALNVPYIRLFGDYINSEWGIDKSCEFIAEGMKRLLEYGEKNNVMPLFETHGDFIKTELTMDVLERLKDYNVGAIWHISGSYGLSEPLAETYRQLKPWLRDLHITDYNLGSDGKHLYCITGQGLLPIKEVYGMLVADGYDKFFTLEWEKYWIPELEEPEIAFPAHIKYIKTLRQGVVDNEKK